MGNNEKTKALIKKEMIKLWNITTSDFMGYYIDSTSEHDGFSYHHLRVPNSEGGKVTVHNGAILCRESSHDYLHLIEKYDPDRYLYIKNILIEVNNQIYLPTTEQILRINGVLGSFENEYSGFTNSKGSSLIKECYVKRRRKL